MLAKTCKQGLMTLDIVGSMKAVKSTGLSLLISEPSTEHDGNFLEIKIKERAWWELWRHEYGVKVEVIIYNEHPFWKGARND